MEQPCLGAHTRAARDEALDALLSRNYPQSRSAARGAASGTNRRRGKRRTRSRKHRDPRRPGRRTARGLRRPGAPWKIMGHPCIVLNDVAWREYTGCLPTKTNYRTPPVIIAGFRGHGRCAAVGHRRAWLGARSSARSHERGLRARTWAVMVPRFFAMLNSVRLGD